VQAGKQHQLQTALYTNQAVCPMLDAMSDACMFGLQLKLYCSCDLPDAVLAENVLFETFCS